MGYHTQEKWAKRLSGPIKCIRDDAWLGEGYYFWIEEVHAIQWGRSSKRGSGFFEIYIAEINCDNILDTVFNEEHYKWWVKQLEKVAGVITKKTGKKPSIKEINEYFRERGALTSIDGVLFQDLPSKRENTLIDGLFYLKRIQLVAYNLNIILKFNYHTEYRC